jgi:hypothetical protein
MLVKICPMKLGVQSLQFEMATEYGKKGKKVKQSRYRRGVAQWFPRS